MTTIRHIDPKGNPYFLPVRFARDKEFDQFMAEQLREWLWRQGIDVFHIPADQLLRSVRYTFQTVKSSLERGTISLVSQTNSGGNTDGSIDSSR